MFLLYDIKIVTLFLLYDIIIDLMKTYGMPAEEIRLIQYLYWEWQAHLNQTWWVENERKVVGQGCVLSSVIFNMYSEELLKRTSGLLW